MVLDTEELDDTNFTTGTKDLDDPTHCVELDHNPLIVLTHCGGLDYIDMLWGFRRYWSTAGG